MQLHISPHQGQRTTTTAFIWVKSSTKRVANKEQSWSSVLWYRKNMDWYTKSIRKKYLSLPYIFCKFSAT